MQQALRIKEKESVQEYHKEVFGIRFSQKSGNLPIGYNHKYTYSHKGCNLSALCCPQMNNTF